MTSETDETSLVSTDPSLLDIVRCDLPIFRVDVSTTAHMIEDDTLKHWEAAITVFDGNSADETPLTIAWANAYRMPDVSLDDEDDDIFRLLAAADEVSGDLHYVSERVASDRARFNREFEMPMGFLYLEHVEVSPTLRGHGLGLMVASRLLHALTSGADPTLVLAIAGTTNPEKVPAEEAAIRSILVGLGLDEYDPDPDARLWATSSVFGKYDARVRQAARAEPDFS